MLSHPFSFSARSLLLIHKVRCPFLFTSVITPQWPQTALTIDPRSLSKGFYRPELYKSKPDYVGIFKLFSLRKKFRYHLLLPIVPFFFY